MRLTTKQEAFAQAVITAPNTSAAYREAYETKNMKDSTINRQAHEAMASPKIAARIEELRREAAKRNETTIDSLLAELEEARQAALSHDPPQSKAAIDATMGKARLLGLDAPPPAVQVNTQINQAPPFRDLYGSGD